MPYQDSVNKSLIRRTWDLPILTDWQVRSGVPLAYFGMCGTEMLDIRDWRIVIGNKCCIESLGNDAEEKRQLPMRMARMKTVANVEGLAGGFQPLVGLVEDIILTGLDVDNERPVLSDRGETAEDTLFRYHLYNLDFDGGFGFQSEGGQVRRVRALSKLFDRQAGEDFVLLLTVNVRDTIESIIDAFVAGLGRRNYGANWRELVEWHRERGQDEHVFLLKAAVPLYIQRQAEAHGFLPKCYSPIVYQGHNRAILVHFVFEFTYATGSIGAVGEQEELDLLRLPLLRSAGGKLLVVSRDSPGFDADSCLAMLAPLTDEERAVALTAPLTVPARRRAR